MLLLYLLLLGMLAAFTAYTRHLQSTVKQQIPGAAGRIATPRQQTLRILALVLGWPAALGLGMLFVAWWKAAALVAAAFLLLVPVLGSLMPRPMSAHHLDRIRADLERRVARGAGGARDAGQLERILEQIEAITARCARPDSSRPPGPPT
jgi:hypothetical protein